VVHSQIGQHAAIESDIRLAQTRDQAAIAETASARCRIDAHDPQCAELTLFLTTIAIGVLTGLDDGLLSNTESTRTGTVVTFREFQDFLVTATSGHTTFYTSHLSIPRRKESY